MKYPSLFVIMSEIDGVIKPYNGVIWKRYYGTKPRVRTYKSAKTAQNQLDRYAKEYAQAVKYREEHGESPSWQRNGELMDTGKLTVVEYKAVEK